MKHLFEVRDRDFKTTAYHSYVRNLGSYDTQYETTMLRHSVDNLLLQSWRLLAFLVACCGVSGRQGLCCCRGPGARSAVVVAI